MKSSARTVGRLTAKLKYGDVLPLHEYITMKEDYTTPSQLEAEDGPEHNCSDEPFWMTRVKAYLLRMEAESARQSDDCTQSRGRAGARKGRGRKG